MAAQVRIYLQQEKGALSSVRVHSFVRLKWQAVA
ncbi:hypothetical protein T4B_14795 [Trichinella pseudospiralis]|uniref:Uncharacterized protein n=1 Tax=Trichinella pseudospiralis TaxID=6337 RepID=A0A0V1GBU7_TRIPS|nr:hypothetical protein T4B_14795 [Trichinella pseudospiralis]KRY97013.1 hypothetical protein T4C_10294 [Trichinella pseudospiralis]